jgi:hypothetical protein
MLSKNTASSRAIPSTKYREGVLDDPAIPIHWGKAQKGMQATEELADTGEALDWWMIGMEMMAWHHAKGEALGLHKQILNRIMEPWSMVTSIISGTDWENFFALRIHTADNMGSQWEIHQLATEILLAVNASTPKVLKTGQWHTPFVDCDNRKSEYYVGAKDFPEEANGYGPQLVSAARCARVSYLTHDKKKDTLADFELAKRLAVDGHWSPFEHVAIAMETNTSWGNFFGFKQLRKFFTNENIGRSMP